MLVAKDIDKIVLNYIDPWGETIIYISWLIKSFYHHTIGYTPFQAVFDRDIIFNLA